MKKSDLKTGMIVEDSDGVLRIIISKTAIGYTDGGLDLREYTEDLTHEYMGSIDKVYSIPKSKGGLCASFGFWLRDREFLNYCKLLWERTPEKIIKFDGVEYSESTLRSIIKKATE